MKVTSYVRALKKQEARNFVFIKKEQAIRIQERLNNNQQLVIVSSKETCNND